MEEARRKLRICLIFVVALAVIVGCVYYFGDMKSRKSVSEGTLVKAEMQSQEEAAYGIEQ